jgi:endonuclease-3 related protein
VRSIEEGSIMTTGSFLPMYSPPSKLLLEIYYRLFHAYGTQGWWPTTKKGCLHPTYQKGWHTLSESERFEIIVGAILTQHTSWINAEKAIISLNENGMMKRTKLAQMEPDELASVIKSSGYYRQKATRLKSLVIYLSQYPSLSEWLQKDSSELRPELLLLNGIGPETADSILLYAAEKAIFVIDAYTQRIFSRLGRGLLGKAVQQANPPAGKVQYEELQSLFMKHLPHDVQLFNDYHALLVVLAQHHCQKNPSCKKTNPSGQKCPLLNICAFNGF